MSTDEFGTPHDMTGFPNVIEAAPEPPVSGIYELSEYQFGALHDACNGGSICFAALRSSPKDSPEKAEEIDGQYQEILDLIRLDLLSDVSDKFGEQIQVAKINSNREFIVVAVTDLAILMFRGSEKRKAN